MTKIPDGWVLVPKVPTDVMVTAALAAPIGLANVYVAMVCAAPPPPGDPEVELGKSAPGLTGATYRFIDRCDYREAIGWMRSEILRNTQQIHIIEVVAGAIAGIAIGAAGNIARSQMAEFARRVMVLADHVVKKDVVELTQHKKAETVLHNRIRLVPPSDGG